MEKSVRKSVISEEIILLGKQIETIIKKKMLKTTEVAHDADMYVENLRKFIKCKQEMKISTIWKIVKAFGKSVNELF